GKYLNLARAQAKRVAHALRTTPANRREPASADDHRRDERPHLVHVSAIEQRAKHRGTAFRPDRHDATLPERGEQLVEVHAAFAGLAFDDLRPGGRDRGLPGPWREHRGSDDRVPGLA